jgi:NAD(P)H-hydrate epimerase
VADDRVQQIADLLHEAGEIHHGYFADTDGADDDWATFYSDWLLTRTKLPALLGRRPVRSHLTRDLVVCDEEYTVQTPGEPWPRWYAMRLIEKYG